MVQQAVSWVDGHRAQSLLNLSDVTTHTSRASLSTSYYPVHGPGASLVGEIQMLFILVIVKRIKKFVYQVYQSEKYVEYKCLIDCHLFVFLMCL